MTNESTHANEGYGFIDGEYVPMSEMKLPVTDLGFQLAEPFERRCCESVHRATDRVLVFQKVINSDAILTGSGARWREDRSVLQALLWW